MSRAARAGSKKKTTPSKDVVVKKRGEGQRVSYLHWNAVFKI
jgi:hypothetical protein